MAAWYHNNVDAANGAGRAGPNHEKIKDEVLEHLSGKAIARSQELERRPTESKIALEITRDDYWDSCGHQAPNLRGLSECNRREMDEREL